MKTMTACEVMDPTARTDEPDEARIEADAALEGELEQIERTFSDRWEW